MKEQADHLPEPERASNQPGVLRRVLESIGLVRKHIEKATESSHMGLKHGEQVRWFTYPCVVTCNGGQWSLESCGQGMFESIPLTAESVKHVSRKGERSRSIDGKTLREIDDAFRMQTGELGIVYFAFPMKCPDGRKIGKGKYFALKTDEGITLSRNAERQDWNIYLTPEQRPSPQIPTCTPLAPGQKLHEIPEGIWVKVTVPKTQTIGMTTIQSGWYIVQLDFDHLRQPIFSFSTPGNTFQLSADTVRHLRISQA